MGTLCTAFATFLTSKISPESKCYRRKKNKSQHAAYDLSQRPSRALSWLTSREGTGSREGGDRARLGPRSPVLLSPKPTDSGQRPVKAVGMPLFPLHRAEGPQEPSRETQRERRRGANLFLKQQGASGHPQSPPTPFPPSGLSLPTETPVPSQSSKRQRQRKQNKPPSLPVASNISNSAYLKEARLPASSLKAPAFLSSAGVEQRPVLGSR